jgi:hypothetical protein
MQYNLYIWVPERAFWRMAPRKGTERKSVGVWLAYHISSWMFAFLEKEAQDEKAE